MKLKYSLNEIILLSVFTHLSWPMYVINMYMYNTKKMIIFITHKMAITRKIHFQINFDYKVMTNYKIMSYCYMH